jgi:cellulose synthase/poly-beta-1,6-N-acetylglucosamine synthase-like glycosyltransferase
MIDLLAWVLMLPSALATLVLVVELVAAHWPRISQPATTPDSPLRIAILIPAHNEASAIEATVTDIKRVAPAGTRILVVADNCTDDTAPLARSAGAEVVERHDSDRRGKGHALAFGRDHLAADPPEVVMVIDADCTVPGDGILRLAATACRTGRPVQSTYLMRPRSDRGALAGLSGFAFLVRNLVRQHGLARIGAPALLTGSGMAFEWAMFRTAPLATDDLVEDLALGLHFARAGMPPLFLDDVHTWSEPAPRNAAYGQRIRWEQGFLRRASREAWPLLTAGRWSLLWLGLHLLVPPVALLIAIDAIVFLLLIGLVGLGATPAPLILLSPPLFVLPILIALSWARFGRDQIGPAQLLLAPFYILWKLPIYIAALVRPERHWNRTGRD